jgi:lipopolysaccharide transport system permease protein
MESVREITPRKTFSFAEIKELWHYRELIYFFAWRDYKVRYKETVIGALWALFQPLLTMIVFVIFFGRFEEISSTGIPYALFAYSGLTFWHFFSNAVLNASNSLINNNSIITKAYFPRIIIPISAVIVYFIDLAFAFIVLLGLMAFYGFTPTLAALFITPLLVLVLALAVLGISLFLSSLIVKFRDIKYIIPFFIQLSLFVSPVIYSISVFPAYAHILKFNPLTGVIEAFRSVLFGLSAFPWEYVIYSVIVSVVIFLIGAIYFKYSEEYISDII